LEQVTEFFAMGGYAAYVWPAYAISAIVLLAVLGVSTRSLRRAEAELAALRSTADNTPAAASSAALGAAAGDGR
jgi:heme exporter protein D